MKIVVVGAGAVGTFLGDKFRALGNDVVYLAREPQERIATDLVIVAVKAFDTPGAIATINAGILDPKTTTILTVQNGVGNEELLATAFGDAHMVAGGLTIPVEGALVRRNSGVAAGAKAEASPGRAAAAGGIAIAPVGSDTNNWLMLALAASGLSVGMLSDYRALKWSKLALNIIANASCAILDIEPRDIVRNPELFALELAALRETRNVMRAMKLEPVNLPRYPVRLLFFAASLPASVARVFLGKKIAGGRGAKPPSLLLDLRSGCAMSEVGVLNGAVVAAGRRHHVATPVNDALTRILEAIVVDPSLWERYRKKPSVLLEDIRRHRSTPSDRPRLPIGVS